MKLGTIALVLSLTQLLAVEGARAQTAGTVGQSGADDLVVVDAGKSTARIVVSPGAGPNEKLAAADLAKYVEIMSGARLAVADTDAAVAEALASSEPLLIVGGAALAAEPSLNDALAKSLKKNPELRADGIVLARRGKRVYVAGNHDEAHYFAVAQLLRLWGCRWYLPSEFGECIPRHTTLKVGALDYAYGSPFEVRNYWIAWNGSQDARPDFMRRNFMNNVGVSGGHAVGQYVTELVPPGKSVFNVPIADDKTAEHVAGKIATQFAAGQDITLGMEDGIYESDSELDRQLQAGLYDKYFLNATLTDNFMVFYNKVCAILQKQHPDSKSRIGFLAYSNMTIPPQRELTAAKPLVASLAPIDIDPIHSMDSPLSPPRQEYREMMYRWAKVMQGRVFIYDYDQGMLVWHDLPNPSIQSIRHDIQHYLKAGILGLSTESRGAMATVFLNLYIRGQLMWDPAADVDALLAEFYPNFYGPAAAPMEKYWSAIYRAWEETIVTEHEHFVVPAIYTPQLVAALREQLVAAEAAMQAAAPQAATIPDWDKFQQRMRFTRLSFDLIDHYTQMVQASATDVDYAKAVAHGERCLAIRLELANMNPSFTTRVIDVAAQDETSGPAWFPGHVKQFRDLSTFTNGTQGTLIARLPLEWAYRRDPNDTGVASGWAYNPVDLSYWEQHGRQLTPVQRKDYPDQWEMLRTDLYAQAQGIRHANGHSFTGHHWYRTAIELTEPQTSGPVHVRFPGMFNEAWLYVNGHLVAHRPQGKMWWLNDYAFEWDVDLAGKLRPGENTIALRLHNPHHFGGLFRRPFLYQAKK